MTNPTDDDIAAMPHIADASLAATFHWTVTEEERLYRECPSAFWLAPGGTDDLLPMQPAPIASTQLVPEANDENIATGVRSAIGFASAVAGPVFISAFSLVSESGETPIERMAAGIALGLVSAPLSIPVGALAAIMPVILGVTLLGWLGSSHPLARRRSLWAAVGAGMGLIIAAAFDAGMTAIPLVLTSIACATVAHKAVDWPHVEPA